MKIIQFTCADEQLVAALKAMMLQQINVWSRLQRLSNDPDYVTDTFGEDIWKQHTVDTNLYWADWDAVYACLGDDGRIIADQFLGDGPFQGILLITDLLPDTAPGVRLQIVEVADLVVAGYLPEPASEVWL